MNDDMNVFSGGRRELCQSYNVPLPCALQGISLFFHGTWLCSVGLLLALDAYSCVYLQKAAALAFYILFSLFVKSFVIIFVITVLLAALDFWVVKNVSGRILVGLRWWNEIDDEGNSVWKFECLDGEVCLCLFRVSATV